LREKLKSFFLKYKFSIFAFFSFFSPLVIYILTLERKVIGGDTTWYAIQIPQMYVLVPTGYPTFSFIGKLFSMIPLGDLAYRLNLISAIFGAFTILFIFLSINKLTNDKTISLAASLLFAFLPVFWNVANRLEFDTLNSFFIALTIFSIISYAEHTGNKSNIENKKYFISDKYFYLSFFSMGLSLTNHPIAFFVLPAFLIYIVIIDPKKFKCIKKIILSILFFIKTLISYIYIPIRSFQGFGNVNTFRDFINYITGRQVTGETFGGFYERSDLQQFLKVTSDFFLSIYKDFGIVLILIVFIGFLYLIKKNWKFLLISVLLIFFNVFIITQYLGWCPKNYTIDSIIILIIYLGFGFLAVKNFIYYFIGKLNSREKNTVKLSILRSTVSIILIIAFFTAPVLLAVNNYASLNKSKPEKIYLFWNDIFCTVENNSYIYTASSSENIGMFINLYEKTDKHIKYITSRETDYSVENIKGNLKQGKKVYLAGIEDFLIPHFNLEKIDSYHWDRFNENLIVYRVTGEKLQLEKIDSYHWDRFNENLIVYRVTGEKLQLEIEPVVTNPDIRFGDIFKIEYIIKNSHDKDLKITSIELSISKNLKFVEVDSRGFINQQPSLSGEKYMWVKEYIIEAESEINIIIKLRAQTPGQAEVKFSITSQDIYMNSPNIIVTVEK